MPSAASVINKILAALGEGYVSTNSRLLNYLRERPLSSYDVREWIGSWDGSARFAEETGANTDAFDMEETDDTDMLYDLCHEFDAWLANNEEEKEEFATYLQRHNADMVPSWSYFSLESERLLPASSWLVHWSDHAEDISRYGFRRGVDDMVTLGLTTYLGQSAKSRPGYNFAFRIESGEAENPNRKYGGECVVFQSSGVLVYHHGDEEEQVIFWGPAITRKPILVKQSDGRWVVVSERGKPVYSSEDINNAFAWIKKMAR